MYETDIVLSDTHIPFADWKTISVVENFIKDLQPNRIILNGDIIDCWEISSFDKSPRNEIKLKEEINLTKGWLEELNKIAPKSQKIFIFGNHEFRFEKYIIRNAKALFGLKGLTLEEQLELKKMNYQVINSGLRESYYDTGKGLLIGHFNKINKFSAYTAKNLIDKYGVSLIQSHCHRLGKHCRTIHNKILVGVEQGCLCNLNPSYMLKPDWQSGFALVTWINRKPNIEIVSIQNHMFFYGGKIYK